MKGNIEELRLLSLSEAASILDISEKTVRRMTKTGKFPAFKVGGQWRIQENRLKKWIEEMEQTKGAQKRV